MAAQFGVVADLDRISRLCRRISSLPSRLALARTSPLLEVPSVLHCSSKHEGRPKGGPTFELAYCNVTVMFRGFVRVPLVLVAVTVAV